VGRHIITAAPLPGQSEEEVAMNLVGKIFIVLIFVMSLVWMAFTVAVYATHKNWRELVVNETAEPGKPLGLLPQLDELKARYDDLKKGYDATKEQLEQEKLFKRQALAKLENKNEELQTQLDQREQEYAQEVQERRDAVGALDATNQRLKAQTAELESVRAEALQAKEQRDANMEKVVQLTDELNQQALLLKDLESRYKTLAADAAEMKERLLGSSIPVPPAAWKAPPPPETDGVVLAVGGSGQVEISVGADDGIRKGHQLEVVRGTNYLGRIEIVQTQPDKAVAKILRDMQQGPIQRGDRVKSQLRS
jgi:hypothetical protein